MEINVNRRPYITLSAALINQQRAGVMLRWQWLRFIILACSRASRRNPRDAWRLRWSMWSCLAATDLCRRCTLHQGKRRQDRECLHLFALRLDISKWELMIMVIMGAANGCATIGAKRLYRLSWSKGFEILVLASMYLPEVEAQQMGHPFAATVGGAMVAIRLVGRAPACFSRKGPSQTSLGNQTKICREWIHHTLQVRCLQQKAVYMGQGRHVGVPHREILALFVTACAPGEPMPILTFVSPHRGSPTRAQLGVGSWRDCLFALWLLHLASVRWEGYRTRPRWYEVALTVAWEDRCLISSITRRVTFAQDTNWRNNYICEVLSQMAFQSLDVVLKSIQVWVLKNLDGAMIKISSLRLVLLGIALPLSAVWAWLGKKTKKTPSPRLHYVITRRD